MPDFLKEMRRLAAQWVNPDPPDEDDLYDALVANRFAEAHRLVQAGVGSERVREHVEACQYQTAICILDENFHKHTHLSVLRNARAE